MDTENQQKKSWLTQSQTIKLTIVVALTLFLLIPSSMIQNLVQERKNRSEQVKREIGQTWGGQQSLLPPILRIPISYSSIKDQKKVITHSELVICPEDTDIRNTIETRTKHRGLFDVTIYTSDISIKETYALSKHVNIGHKYTIHYDKAYFTVGVKNLQGINGDIHFKVNNKPKTIHPGMDMLNATVSGFNIPYPISDANLNTLLISCTFKLNGSQRINLLPAGRNTNIDVSSNWTNPSFTGDFLPVDSQSNDKGFKANWAITELSKSFPSSWIGSKYNSELFTGGIGVDFLIPVDNYVKIERSSKYAILTISLTFLLFFLIEMITHKNIHPIQYGLVGLALVLFYSLLLSLSEHIGFNKSYLISTVTIVCMISFYSIGIFAKKLITVIVGIVVTLVYAFIFVTLQAQDFALLLGTLGLLTVLACTMYFTRNLGKSEDIVIQKRT